MLVYTGYGESLAEVDLRSAGIVALLKKPIEPAVLRTHLERVLPQIGSTGGIASGRESTDAAESPPSGDPTAVPLGE